MMTQEPRPWAVFRMSLVVCIVSKNLGPLIEVAGPAPILTFGSLVIVVVAASLKKGENVSILSITSSLPRDGRGGSHLATTCSQSPLSLLDCDINLSCTALKR